MTDLLDWQITDAPGPDETLAVINDALPAPYPARPSLALSRRAARGITLILGGVSVLALVSVGVFWAWNQTQMRAAIEQVVMREVEADRTDDWQALRDLVADTKLSNWHSHFYEIPSPLPFLFPNSSGEVRAITPLESNLVRAEVVYHYRAPDDTPLTFIREQFYRYAHGEWKRAAPPEDLWQETRSYQSVYFNAGYPAVDEAQLMPALLEAQAQLARICAIWLCAEADVPEIKLSFSRTASGSYDYLNTPSVLYQLFVNSAEYERTLTWPALSQSGYPADDASQRWYQHSLTLSLFQRLTNQLAVKHELGKRGVLAQALALRLATRLRLETFPIHEVWVASPTYSLGELWVGRIAEGGVTNSYPWEPGIALRAALVAMNRLLRDQPPEVEDRLFAALFEATDEVDWVARGLQISWYEAQIKLAELEPADTPLVNVLTTQPGVFTLSCGEGLYAYSPGEGAPRRLLDGAYLSANAYSWSPNHQRLLVELNGRLALVNHASQTLTWVPRESAGYYPHWADDTTLFYIAYPINEQPMLHLLDLTGSDRLWSMPNGIIDYIPAPDNSAAIVVQAFTDGLHNQLALLTSLDDASAPRPIGEGSYLAWTPDSQKIIYLWSGQPAGEFALRLVDVHTGITHDLLTNADVITSATDQIALDYPPWAGAQWTPDGQHLAVTLAAYGYGQDTTHTWAGLLRITEPGRWQAIPIERQENSYPIGFSADGEWLAMVSYGPSQFSDPQVVTQLYSTTTGQLVRTFTDLNFNGWSPTGHQLLLSDNSNLYLLNEPGDPAEPPAPLTDIPCMSLLWNPTP